MTPRRARDEDATDALYRLRALPFAVIFGILALGTSVGVAHLPWYVGIVIAALVFTVIWRGPAFLANMAGETGAAIYSPSGLSTPPIRQYSLAESLVARGQYEDAAEAYELLVGDFPHDPEPAVRNARLLRDKMARFEDAAVWYKKALAVEEIQEATEVAVTRELIELFTHKLRTPARALPYLAQLPEKYPANPAAAWARQEYLDIKRGMQEERDV